MNLTQPTFDSSGYPTNETLDVIGNWPANDYDGLKEYLKLAWNCSCGKVYDFPNNFVLITGGWSGNENIIAALQGNLTFWTLHWFSSTRGGMFQFQKEC